MEFSVSLFIVFLTFSEADNFVKDVLILVIIVKIIVITVIKQRIFFLSKGSMLVKMLINYSVFKCREISKLGNQGSLGVLKVFEFLGRKREIIVKFVYKFIVIKYRKIEIVFKVLSKVQIIVNFVFGLIFSIQFMFKFNFLSFQVVTFFSSGIG